VEKAVVFVASAAEQRMKWVHRLFTWYRDCIRSIDVRSAFQWTCNLLLL